VKQADHLRIDSNQKMRGMSMADAIENFENTQVSWLGKYRSATLADAQRSSSTVASTAASSRDQPVSTRQSALSTIAKKEGWDAVKLDGTKLSRDEVIVVGARGIAPSLLHPPADSPHDSLESLSSTASVQQAFIPPVIAKSSIHSKSAHDSRSGSLASLRAQKNVLKASVESAASSSLPTIESRNSSSSSALVSDMSPTANAAIEVSQIAPKILEATDKHDSLLEESRQLSDE
jgi:hypothetical protein